MDSIKSKMLSLSQATAEATARTLVFEEELRKNNEVAEKYEEQVRAQRLFNLPYSIFKWKIIEFWNNSAPFTFMKHTASNYSKENAVFRGSI